MTFCDKITKAVMERVMEREQERRASILSRLERRQLAHWIKWEAGGIEISQNRALRSLIEEAYKGGSKIPPETSSWHSQHKKEWGKEMIRRLKDFRVLLP